MLLDRVVVLFVHLLVSVFIIIFLESPVALVWYSIGFSLSLFLSFQHLV
jgi:hypothetical protein